LGRLGDGKILGGIGSILELVPGVSIVGYILTLIAVKFISDELGDSSIFTDMILAVLTGIVGIGVAAFFILFGVFAAPFTFGMSGLAGIIGFLVVAWIALIFSAIFVRRAFGKMATRLNVGYFKTAGTLYFVGAILVIVLVGFVILLIAYIFQVIAFFSIPDTLQQAPGVQASPAPMSAAPMAQGGVKYCSSCGTQMAASAVFCPKCGARQA
jgi:uncharacterized membrane protein